MQGRGMMGASEWKTTKWHFMSLGYSRGGFDLMLSSLVEGALGHSSFSAAQS